jgi:hypothetical protein
MLQVFFFSSFFLSDRTFQVCAHPFFDELRDPNTRLPSGKPLPPLFNFSAQGTTAIPSVWLWLWLWLSGSDFASEIQNAGRLCTKLIPPHAYSELSPSAIETIHQVCCGCRV